MLLKVKYPLIFLVVCLLSACIPKQADHTGRWISLLPDKSMKGWISNGKLGYLGDTLVVIGPGSHYYTGNIHQARFKNFEFTTTMKTQPGAVAGLWIHSGNMSGYHILIDNTPTNEGRHKTGSLSSIRNIYKSMAADNEWFTLRIKVVGKHITIKVNNILVVDYVEPDNPYRLAENAGMRFSEGTFVLSNNTENSIKIRNMNLMPLSDREKPERTDAIDEQNDDIIRLQQAYFPVIDFHVHLKGWNQEQAMENSRRTGIYYGLAPNCGIGFPVTSDEDIYTYLDTTKNLSCFQAMQGEGREWVTTFSEEARSKFDYVFTDAMTFTDHRGRRTRLWIPEEVHIDIPHENYMDIIVDRTVKVLLEEPIDIFVNPTFLPAQMSPDYDLLWTDERINRVIRALLDRGIALEINARYRLPGEKIIRAAKEAGVRFAFGTNNEDQNIGKLEYCIEMMEKCGITYYDMFFPEIKEANNKSLKSIFN